MSRPVYLRETRHDAVKAAITFAACGTSDLDAREWAVRRWGEAYAPLEINKAVAAGDLGSARYPCVAMTLTTFLAAWGAVLSSIMALREVLASRDKLKVQLIHGVSDELGACAVLFIANPGKRGVMVEYAGFAWPFETLSFVKKLRQFLKYRNHWGTIGWCHTPLAADIVESSPLPSSSNRATPYRFGYRSSFSCKVRVTHPARSLPKCSMRSVGTTTVSRCTSARNHPVATWQFETDHVPTNRARLAQPFLRTV